MENKRENLIREMKFCSYKSFPEELITALNELLYTAVETGVLEYRVGVHDLETFLKILLVAEKYMHTGVPDELRM